MMQPYQRHTRIVPKLDSSEVVLGKWLGSGEFCNVHEVIGISLGSTFHLADNVTDEEEKEREWMSNNFSRSGQMRYAVKGLKSNASSGSSSHRMDVMNMELRLLSMINNQHSNIIKFRAIISNKENGDIMLMLDRLDCMLNTKIYKIWAPMVRRVSKRSNIIIKSIMIVMLKNSLRIRRDLILDRLTVALDLARALKFLHKQRIIYRDLKPHNIGFDVRGDLKLFDFGLSRVLPTETVLVDNDSDDQKTNDTYEFYKMTGGTGTLRYMAPEVVLRQPYGPSADVFSYGILLWEIMSCKLPFPHMSLNYHHQNIVLKGVRPQLTDFITCDWSESLICIIKSCWDASPKKRPTFATIVTMLEGEISHTRSMNVGRKSSLLSDFSESRSVKLRNHSQHSVAR